MSNINFRKTRTGNFAADFARSNGFGFETRYYRRAEVKEQTDRRGWSSPDEEHTDGVSIAEVLILHRAVEPYRVVAFY